MQLTKEANTKGLVPNSKGQQLIAVGELNQADKPEVIGTPIVIFEDDDIQILMIKKR